MMKKIVQILLVLFLWQNLYATHNRAGQIVYEHVDGYTYKIYIWTYTYTLSAADRDSLPVKWGDGTQEYLKRVKKITLPDYYYENLYIGYHTYPGPGTYEIVMEDPNRNKDIVNIENSVNTVFALKTVLQINPFVGHNNSPELLNRPIDKGAVGQVFIHNPGAYDADGDSLSFKMDTCRYNDGQKIPWFRLPQASDTLYVDPRTGDLVWDTPVQLGKYNMALRVEEWRDGMKISSIIRDMQIEIQEVDNNAPVIQDIPSVCVEAGETVDFDVTATDADNDSLLLTASGGPFEVSVSPAIFPDSIKGQGLVTGHFHWETTCDHIRKEPYLVTFKVKDDNPELSLIDYKSMFITVVPPGTQLVDIQPSNATILIKWNKTRCDNCTEYLIYRKTTPDTYDTTRCQTGVPSSWGYELIDRVPATDTSYIDDNHGHGLVQGFYYCYRIVPVFNDVQGYASNILCTELVEGMPIMIRASVDNTDKTQGRISVGWIKPINLDTTVVTPPFRYYLYYSNDLYGAHYYGPIILDGIDTTSFADTNINTVYNPRIYKLTLTNWDTITNSWQPVGNPTIASTPYLSGIGYDRAVKLTVAENVPWLVKGHAIYRLNETTSTFDSVGYTTAATYYDRGLVNEHPYTYKVKSIGYYTADTLPHYLENWSQEITVVPIDTIPPCCPDVTVESYCQDGYNLITWHMPQTDSCTQGLAKYELYYKARIDTDYVKIKEFSPSDTMYKHFPTNTLAACYVLVATDSAGNTSNCFDKENCIDICTYYNLPNVFTPNGDGVNDIFHPYPYRFVEKVDMKIYNRWGNLVYQTDNPDINWDGTDMHTGKPVDEGIYYYICDVYERRLTGIKPRNISGFIHLYRKSKSSND